VVHGQLGARALRSGTGRWRIRRAGPAAAPAHAVRGIEEASVAQHLVGLQAGLAQGRLLRQRSAARRAPARAAAAAAPSRPRGRRRPGHSAAVCARAHGILQRGGLAHLHPREQLLHAALQAQEGVVSPWCRGSCSGLLPAR
jgi:hypothetical protein